MSSFPYVQRRSFAAGTLGREPIDLAAKWEKYVRCPVKAATCIALSGSGIYCSTDYEIAQAIGLIELVGHREGLRTTKLYVGFILSAPLPAPSFRLTPEAAVGTMTLTADCYPAFMQLATQRGAHFQIGGDGRWNALASDLAGLAQLDSMTSLGVS